MAEIPSTLRKDNPLHPMAIHSILLGITGKPDLEKAAQIHENAVMVFQPGFDTDTVRGGQMWDAIQAPKSVAIPPNEIGLAHVIPSTHENYFTLSAFLPVRKDEKGQIETQEPVIILQTSIEHVRKQPFPNSGSGRTEPYEAQVQRQLQFDGKETHIVDKWVEFPQDGGKGILVREAVDTPIPLTLWEDVQKIAAPEQRNPRPYPKW